MGVKIRKRNGSWYVFVDYCGRRKAKCVGSRSAAQKVKAKLEARLALGDLGFFPPSANYSPFSASTPSVGCTRMARWSANVRRTAPTSNCCGCM